MCARPRIFCLVCCRLHRHVKLRLLRDSSSVGTSSSSSGGADVGSGSHHKRAAGLRVAAVQQHPQKIDFVFRVTASLGEDDDDDESDVDHHIDSRVAAAAAGPPQPHSRLSVAAATVTSSRSRTTTNNSSGGSVNGSVSAAAAAAPAAAVLVSRPRGAVLEVPEGFSQREFVEAVQTAVDVQQVVPDRLISITQGECVCLISSSSNGTTGKEEAGGEVRRQ